MTSRAVSADDRLDTLVAVLDLTRNGDEWTRPEITRVSGLGRNVVTQRTAQLVEWGLLAEVGLSSSTGGRAARGLRFSAGAGHVLVAELGATTTSFGLSDLTGHLLSHRSEPSDITDGPEAILGRVAMHFEQLLHDNFVDVWGVGVGVPGPVEFTSGKPVAPPIMPGWDGFDIRGFFSRRFHAPTWVDNDVNVMALGELRDGLALGRRDVIYVKVGSGIGAGLISRGKLHRGAQGSAGDIGHIGTRVESKVVCRCGQVGCLEALAGGAALARQGRSSADAGESPYLSKVLEAGREITAADVGRGAIFGDQRAVELVTESARLVGETLSHLVNFFNPSLVLLGGGVTEIGDLYLAVVRQEVLSRSLPLATRALLIERSPLGNTAGLKGAAFMVVDELLSRDGLARWIEDGSPAGHPEVALHQARTLPNPQPSLGDFEGPTAQRSVVE
jgi:glucokinase-like ROK family protein